jgi:hypothetical protein
MLAIKRFAAVPIFLLSLMGAGCDNMRSTLAPEFRGQTIPVQKIGITGPGASLATQEFIAQGYNVHELGAAENGIEAARGQGLPFVAVVDAVDTSQAVWDGMYSFSMRVSNAGTGTVVWSASGTFGQAGIFINLQAASKNAMKAMVLDFAKTFPPATDGPR